MSVKKRGRSWEIRLQVGGHKIARSLGRGSTRQDALELEAKIRRNHIAGKLGHAPERTIGEAIERWLDGEAKGHLDSKGDEQKARMWLPWVENRLLRDAVTVAARAIDGWIAAKLCPATINRRISMLRRICRLAHSQWGWLDEDLSRKLVALPGERQRNVFLSRLIMAKPKENQKVSVPPPSGMNGGTATVQFLKLIAPFDGKEIQSPQLAELFGVQTSGMGPKLRHLRNDLKREGASIDSYLLPREGENRRKAWKVNLSGQE